MGTHRAQTTTTDRVVGVLRRFGTAPLVAGLVLFFGPGVAFVLGARPEAFENRALAPRPSLDAGWNFPGQFNSWATDHLPLRAEAVQVNDRLFRTLTGSAPSYVSSDPSVATAYRNNVVEGKNGWLYYGDDFALQCRPEMDLRSIIDALQRIHTAIVESGRRAVISVVPDKSTIYPEHLPENLAYLDCAQSRKAQFWRELANSGIPVLDFREPLRQAREKSSVDIYSALNSHWTDPGAALWSREILRQLDPALVANQPVPWIDPPDPASSFMEKGKTTAPGDLTTLLGEVRSEEVPSVTVNRPGVTVSVDGVPLATPDDIPMRYGLTGVVTTETATATGAGVHPGNTLIIADSFYHAFARKYLPPFLSRASAVALGLEPELLRATLSDADTVIVQIVERNAASGAAQILHPEQLRTLETALASNPLN